MRKQQALAAVLVTGLLLGGWIASGRRTSVPVVTAVGASAAAQPASPSPSATSEEPVSVSVLQNATVGPALTFATFNVCKVACAPPAPSWDVRRDRVARVISESDVDVLGLQEATNNPTSFTKTQAEDIGNLTAPAGFRAPTYPQSANECRRPRDAAGQLAGTSPCDNTAMLLYQQETVEQVTLPDGQPSAGILLAGSITPGLDQLSAIRSVAWAYLQGRNGTGPFLAVSLHTDSAKTPEGEASRVALAGGLDGWAQGWNAAHGVPGIPVILMADLNSFAKRQPNGAQTVLTKAGWTDAATSRSARNLGYSTINYTADGATDAQGFPSRPKVYPVTRSNPSGGATRIDYIMAKGAGVVPVDYEVVVRLNSDGTFTPDYQASDHQMVRATLSFPGG